MDIIMFSCCIVSGNKCFQVNTITSTDDGLTWQEAREKCQKGPGYYPDLASIHSDIELCKSITHYFLIKVLTISG